MICSTGTRARTTSGPTQTTMESRRGFASFPRRLELWEKQRNQTREPRTWYDVIMTWKNLAEAATADALVQSMIDDASLTPEKAAAELGAYGVTTSPRAVRRFRSANKRTALILSDWQVDLHDQDFLDRVYDLAREVKPDVIVHTGDESDNTSIGRWVQGAPEEVEGNLQAQLDRTKELLARFRNLPSVQEMGIVSSNHGLRFERAIRSRIPAFRHLRCLQYENLLELPSLGIDYHRDLWEVFPGVVALHGDQKGWNLSSQTQYSKMQRNSLWLGKSVIAGHTHKPMLTNVTSAERNLWVMNTGHSMAMPKVDYLDIDRGGVDGWGQAVGVVEWDGKTAHPQLVLNVGGEMRYKGRVF